jgi:NADH-quinone oxidoreductase subunit G
MTISLKIDNREVEVAEGATIMEAADAAGIRIPRFCHHPKLSNTANCRICAVEVKGRDGLVMSCREQALDGMEVMTDTIAVEVAREDVLEFMLANHPIDCPICDRSGECDLQDIYFKHSRRRSRLTEPKVRKPKAVAAGPHVMLDAERCIGCTRCIRFLTEVAGGGELGLFERGERTEIGVLPGTEFANPYSLCTVDLCPVGALTSSDFRFKKRAWFLESSETICAGCARGCSAWLDHADGAAYRLRPREGGEGGGPWMCDEGRMTYRELDPSVRLASPRILRDGEYADVGWEEAVERALELLGSVEAESIACVLSAQTSVEENLALAKFAKETLGTGILLWSGRPEDPSFADEVLRMGDRNPNSFGVKRISDRGIEHIEEGAGVVILGTPPCGDVMLLMAARPAFVILITSAAGVKGRWADVMLPRPTHFEQDGTFLGEGGKARIFARAIECAAGAVPVWESLGRIARALGKSWDLDSTAACRRWGGKGVKGLGGIEP